MTASARLAICLLPENVSAPATTINAFSSLPCHAEEGGFQIIDRFDVEREERYPQCGSRLLQGAHCKWNVRVTSSPKDRHMGTTISLQDLESLPIRLCRGLKSDAGHVSARTCKALNDTDVDWCAH